LQNLVNKSFANSISLLNVVFGSLSILYTLQGDYYLAAISILLAVIMDGMDGRVARRLDAISELGKQLDSLCDVISFGLAPALLIYAQVLQAYDYRLGLLLFLFYIICATYRLARFNVLNITDYFLGIPITLAGILMACMSLQADHIPANGAGMITFVLSVLMVSNLKVKKIK
jgi:CDP-diacylglycerol--serine O-phosphatidyltransferase